MALDPPSRVITCGQVMFCLVVNFHNLIPKSNTELKLQGHRESIRRATEYVMDEQTTERALGSFTKV